MNHSFHVLSIAGLLALAACHKDNTVVLPDQPAAVGSPVAVTVQTNQPGNRIPADFLGLSYEMSSITDSTYFSTNNPTFISLINGLGPGVLRIGANSVDLTYWSGHPRRPATPKDSVMTTDIDRFSRFTSQLTNWSVIFGLNLGQYNISRAVSEATYVNQSLGSRLLALEVGNEVDLYAGNGLRTKAYTYSAYQQEFDAYQQAVTAALPGIPFSGPAIAGQLSWATQFAANEKSTVKLLTAHHYHMGPASDSTMTITRLLASESKLSSYANTLQGVATANQLPYRIAEANSVFGGGRQGVSNTLAAALWAVDMMWTLASQNCQGVNFHGGGSGPYTPIAVQKGQFSARPEYYAMLLFKSSIGGQVLPVTTQTGSLNVSAYACLLPNGQMAITLINKEAATAASITINTTQAVSSLMVQRLNGPSLTATDGITLAGSTVTPGGTFQPATTEQYAASGTSFRVNVSAGSAALVLVK